MSDMIQSPFRTDRTVDLSTARFAAWARRGQSWDLHNFAASRGDVGLVAWAITLEHDARLASERRIPFWTLTLDPAAPGPEDGNWYGPEAPEQRLVGRLWEGDRLGPRTIVGLVAMRNGILYPLGEVLASSWSYRNGHYSDIGKAAWMPAVNIVVVDGLASRTAPATPTPTRDEALAKAMEILSPAAASAGLSLGDFLLGVLEGRYAPPGPQDGAMAMAGSERDRTFVSDSLSTPSSSARVSSSGRHLAPWELQELWA